MAEPTFEELLNAAQAYEQFFVPALFQQWASRVVDAAVLRPGQRVLDVACGTGVLARTAAQRVGSTGSVVGLDLNPGMLAVAKQLAPHVAWRQAGAEALPFPEESFDTVVSQFGLMFFANRQTALSEMARVLARGGRVAVAVWASLDQSPAYATEVRLVERHAGLPAAQPLRSPFSLGSAAEVRELFAATSLRDIQVATYPGTARFPSIRAMLEADLRGWLPLMGVVLEAGTIEAILAEGETALRPYLTASGEVEFACPANIVTATKP